MFFKKISWFILVLFRVFFFFSFFSFSKFAVCLILVTHLWTHSFFCHFQQLLSASMDKTVRLWDLSSKSCLKIFSHSDYGNCLHTLLLRGNPPFFWNLKKGKPVLMLWSLFTFMLFRMPFKSCIAGADKYPPNICLWYTVCPIWLYT